MSSARCTRELNSHRLDSAHGIRAKAIFARLVTSAPAIFTSIMQRFDGAITFVQTLGGVAVSCTQDCALIQIFHGIAIQVDKWGAHCTTLPFEKQNKRDRIGWVRVGWAFVSVACSSSSVITQARRELSDLSHAQQAVRKCGFFFGLWTLSPPALGAGDTDLAGSAESEFLNARLDAGDPFPFNVRFQSAVDFTKRALFGCPKGFRWRARHGGVDACVCFRGLGGKCGIARSDVGIFST